jgi:hypothetical protein
LRRLDTDLGARLSAHGTVAPSHAGDSRQDEQDKNDEQEERLIVMSKSARSTNRR